MGLSASQMRYLSLTARQSNLEYEAQIINSERINLANKSSEANKAYTEGMNNKVIRISNWETGTDGRAQKVWKELTFSSGMEQGFYVVGAGGVSLVPSPYIDYEAGQNISHSEYWSLSESQRANFDYTPPRYDVNNDFTFCRQGETIPKNVWDVLFQGHSEKFEPQTDDNGNITGYLAKEDVIWRKEDSYITENQYRMLVERGFNSSNFTERTPAVITAKNSFHSINENYSGMDIQSLLVSGQGQIVTATFYQFLCQHGYGTGKYYSLNDDGSKGPETTYEKLVEEFQTTAAYAGTKTVVDWRADEQSYFKEDMYTEDDAVVLANYEATTSQIQHDDKLLELKLKEIETERNAIQTEIEAVKKVIEKNIENSYKTFG